MIASPAVLAGTVGVNFAEAEPAGAPTGLACASTEPDAYSNNTAAHSDQLCSFKCFA
jgi:hypothetical protein